MDLYEYLDTEFSSFEEKPFNVLDAAVLSQFAQVRCEGVVPTLEEELASSRFSHIARTLSKRGPKFVRNSSAITKHATHGVPFIDLIRAENYPGMFTGLAPTRVKRNLLGLAASPRFRPMRVRDYQATFDEASQNQFAAVTITYADEFAFIAFRGTDTSVTGWRENFNMACTTPVPAQSQAVAYLEAVAPHLPKRLIVGGHSKGGNLALYAALKACPEVQDRIEVVYALDSPGFKVGAFSDEEWARVTGRVVRVVPTESIVGMLMDCPIPPKIAEATEHGFDAHTPFSWVNDGTDFVYTDRLADGSAFFDDVCTQWLAQYDDEEAARIVDALFVAIDAAGVTNASEIFFGGFKTIPLITKAAQDIDEDSRNTLLGALRSFAAIAAAKAGSNAVAAGVSAGADLIGRINAARGAGQ